MFNSRLYPAGQRPPSNTRVEPKALPKPRFLHRGRLFNGSDTAVWAALLTFYVVFRLLVVAGFNVSTALTVLSQGDTATILVGTLVTLIRLLPIVADCQSLDMLVEARTQRRRIVPEAHFPRLIVTRNVLCDSLVLFSGNRWIYEWAGEGRSCGNNCAQITTVIASATSVIRCCLKRFQRTEERHITEASQNTRNDGVF